MDTFNHVKNKLSCFVTGLIISIVPLSGAVADDTEIFYVGETVRPKILMILDTSLSMSSHVSGGKSRLTNMKEAMREFINDSDDVDIGLIRMNQISGAVIFPISNLSDLIDDSYSTVSRAVTENHNNAREKPNLSVKKDGLRIDKKLIGLRFENIIIPKSTTINSAYLTFVPSIDCDGSCSDFTITINGELTPNSEIFSETDRNISNRTLTSSDTTVIHTVLASDWQITKTLTTNDVKSLIQPIISQDNWSSGNALSLILTPNLTDDQKNNAYKDTEIYSAKGRYSPVLTINFSQKTRRITKKVKLLEILEDQKLTYHTPVVPALWEAVKYLRGEPVNGAETRSLNLSTTRSATEKSNLDWKYPNQTFYQLDKQHERVAITGALKPNTYTKFYPTGCNNNDTNLNDATCQAIAINGITDPNTNIVTIPSYKSPLTDTCNDDEASIILLTDGGAHHETGSNQSTKWWGKMISEIDAMPGVTCDLTNNSGQGKSQRCGIALATKLRTGISINGLPDDKAIALYTIGFNNNDPWLTSLANQGEVNSTSNSRYSVASTGAELLNVFNAIKNNVLSRTTTFSNSATSVNTSNKLSHSDALYFALFQPSDQAAWFGNLKKYKLGSNGNILAQDDAIAVDPTTGFFNTGIRDMWLPDADLADGANILLGGAASNIPASRTIWVNTATKQLTELSTTDIKFVAADFNETDDVAKNAIITKMLTATKLGDPLHSTPIEVSYTNAITTETSDEGDTDTDDEDDADTDSTYSIIYYGDNHGYLHAINSRSGVELWAFMPKQLLLKQDDIQTNSETQSHIYGMDGEIVKWQTNDRTMIYSGMRRGGSSYYALDVTNASAPTLAWEISNTTSGFGDLGQTWSTPVKTKINYQNNVRDVLIFGGGYDPQQDGVSVKTEDTKGNVIYIIDALTGEKLHEISPTEMKYSIPSDVKAINIDNDDEKTADQIYVGDMGGQLFRVDITDKGILSVGRIANLSGNTTASNRRFYHAPDVSLLDNTSGSTLAIAIGSGYRANPKNTLNQDYFYMIEQPLIKENSTYTTLTQTDLYNATDNDIGSTNLTTANESYIARNAKDGWYISLSSTEKVLASSLTSDDAIWFTTYTPANSNDNCADLNGESRLYRVRASNATPDYRHVIPEVLNNSGLDESKSCDYEPCDVSDRSISLIGTSLPPRPNRVTINGKKLIGIGTTFYQTGTSKTKRMYWTEK